MLMHKGTHTHPFNSFFSGTTRVSWYQKGKTNLDFTKATDSQWQWHQMGHMQVCISLQTDNHASTPPLSFLQAGCPSCHPTNSINALKAERYTIIKEPNQSHNNEPHVPARTLSLMHLDLICGICDVSRCPYVFTMSILLSSSVSTVLLAYLSNSAKPRPTKLRTNGFLMPSSASNKQ